MTAAGWKRLGMAIIVGTAMCTTSALAALAWWVGVFA